MGYAPDPEDKRDADVDKLGLGTTRAGATRIAPRYDRVLNQGRTNSCVAHALCTAVAIRQMANGDRNPVLSSRLFAYYNGRAYTNDEKRDQGTYIRNAVKGARRFGAPDERFHPFKRAQVNRRPPWMSYRKAFDLRDLRYYRIRDGGLRRIEAVKAAIVAGHPVIFGTALDREFLKADGPRRVTRVAGKFVGNHAMVLDGFVPAPGGGTDFDTLNSWGSKWRRAGRVLLAEEVIADPRTRDIWVIVL